MVDTSLENNEISQIKYQVFTYNFKTNIEVVWEFLKDTEKTYEILKDVRSPTVFTKGSTINEKGAEFNILWADYRMIYKTVSEVYETEFHKKMIYSYTSGPINQKLKIIFNLYKISVEDSTVLKWEFIHDEELTISKKQMELITEERREIMKLYETYFSKLKTTQHESISFQCNVKHLWKVLTNWKLLTKLFPEFCEECIYEENFILQPNSNFKVIWNKQKNIESNIKVLKSDYNENNNIYVFHVLSLGNNKEMPCQELHFNICKINKNYCVLEYQHVFLDPVTKEYIEMVKDYKKVLLIKIKKSMMKLYELEKNQENPN